MSDMFSVALDWAANANHTGLFSALRRGYFEDEDIEVNIIAPHHDRFVTEHVLNGEADVAFAFEGTIVDAHVRGEPLLSVAAIARHHWSSLAVLASSNIRSPRDLRNKRYAGFGHDAIEEAIISEMIRNDGATDGAFQLASVRFAAVDVLLEDRADFFWIYDGIEGVDASERGIALRLFSPAQYRIPDYYAPVLFAHEDLLGDPDRRDIARRGMRAIRNGYLFATYHPDEAAEDLVAMAPKFGGLYHQSADIARVSQRDTSSRYIGEQSAENWGMQTLEQWTAFSNFLWQRGALGRVSEPNYAALFTNELLTSAL